MPGDFYDYYDEDETNPQSEVTIDDDNQMMDSQQQQNSASPASSPQQQQSQRPTIDNGPRVLTDRITTLSA
ncbi:hypothetical protein [Dictyobacter formicarum]|uniref:Uncharacterized protein n=1 Tax=Dictyobacter formicarum TaxID=2778368 RepID=A0ABQ3VQN6_9CHLR|nr:hypothetical protein [Dictyobacter formicarum]GHO88177.1 hypothetical protein KSZ_61830 [Dictyobacter formicarum]